MRADIEDLYAPGTGQVLTIEFRNDGTGEYVTPPDGEPFMLFGHYDVVVKVNDRPIWHGRVEEHNRLTGWPGLVSFLAEQVFGNEEKHA